MFGNKRHSDANATQLLPDRLDANDKLTKEDWLNDELIGDAQVCSSLVNVSSLSGRCCALSFSCLALQECLNVPFAQIPIVLFRMYTVKPLFKGPALCLQKPGKCLVKTSFIEHMERCAKFQMMGAG